MTHTFLGLKIYTGPYFFVEEKKKNILHSHTLFFEPGLFFTEAL